jgi:hypothetical protein
MQSEGYKFILTAPLTEIIDNPGFFIQMALASMPKGMERVTDQNYPQWRQIDGQRGVVERLELRHRAREPLGVTLTFELETPLGERFEIGEFGGEGGHSQCSSYLLFRT